MAASRPVHTGTPAPTRLSPGSVQAGGADFEGEATIEEWEDPEVLAERNRRKGGRPKVRKEHIPTHVMT